MQKPRPTFADRPLEDPQAHRIFVRVVDVSRVTEREFEFYVYTIRMISSHHLKLEDLENAIVRGCKNSFDGIIDSVIKHSDTEN